MGDDCWALEDVSEYTPNNPSITASLQASHSAEQDRCRTRINPTDNCHILSFSASSCLFEGTAGHQSDPSVLVTIDKNNEIGETFSSNIGGTRCGKLD